MKKFTLSLILLSTIGTVTSNDLEPKREKSKELAILKIVGGALLTIKTLPNALASLMLIDRHPSANTDMLFAIFALNAGGTIIGSTLMRTGIDDLNEIAQERS